MSFDVLRRVRNSRIIIIIIEGQWKMSQINSTALSRSTVVVLLSVEASTNDSDDDADCASLHPAQQAALTSIV